METSESNSSDRSIDLVLLKREVDSLQIQVNSQNTPWYKSASTILSVVALLFSFGTTFVSYNRTEVQDIQNARIELRSLLQRLASLPKENIENLKKYEATDPAAGALIGGLLNQENAILGRQAAEIARSLPPEYVSSTENFAIAVALQGSYNLDGAIDFVKRAIATSTDFNDRIAALRMQADLLFITGQPEAGRVEYQRALNVFADLPQLVYDDFTKTSTHIWTELTWARSEANTGMIELALQHVRNAELLLAGLMPGQGTQQLVNQVNQLKMLLTMPGGPPLQDSLPVLGTVSTTPVQ